jgi:hypothetical protein
MPGLSYDADSVEYALNQRTDTGAIEGWLAFDDGGYVIYLNGPTGPDDPIPLELRNLREAWIVCQALGSAARAPAATNR